MKIWKASAAAAAALMLALPAQAADLGGNCCADLEERVAELEATTARKGNRRVSLTMYGQISVGVLAHDFDAIPTKWKFLGTDSNSTTRLGVRGEGRINQNWKAGYLLEIGIDPTGDNLDIRYANVWLENAQLGRVTVGQTDQATNGIMEIDLSRSAVANTLGSLAPLDKFIREETTPSLTIPNPFDGTRAEAVRWDSPALAGFRASAAWQTAGSGDTDAWDVALRYAGEFQQIRVAAGIGYRQSASTVPGVLDGPTFWGGSASIMHIPSGLFVAGQYGESDGAVDFKIAGVTIPVGGDDLELSLWGIRGGVETKPFPVGKTTIYGEYGALAGKQNSPSVDLMQYYGLGVVQAIDAAAMDLALSWRNYEVDPDAEFDAKGDINVFKGVAIIKF